MDAGATTTTPPTISGEVVTGYIEDPGWFSQHRDLLATTDWIKNSESSDVNEYFEPKPSAFMEKYADRVYEPCPARGYICVGSQGFSDDERYALFDAMASKFNGLLLARTTAAFNREPGDIVAIGKAAANDANHMSPDDKVAFIRGIARDVAGSELIKDGDQLTLKPNEASQAAALVLASLKGHPTEFDAAVKALKEAGMQMRSGKLEESNKVLKAVVVAGLGLSVEGEAAGAFASPGDLLNLPRKAKYDLAVLQAIADAAHTSGSGAACATLAQAVDDVRTDIVRDTKHQRFPAYEGLLGLEDLRDQLLRDAASRPVEGVNVSQSTFDRDAGR